MLSTVRHCGSNVRLRTWDVMLFTFKASVHNENVLCMTRPRHDSGGGMNGRRGLKNKPLTLHHQYSFQSPLQLCQSELEASPSGSWSRWQETHRCLLWAPLWQVLWLRMFGLSSGICDLSCKSRQQSFPPKRIHVGSCHRSINIPQSTRFVNDRRFVECARKGGTWKEDVRGETSTYMIISW